MPKDKFKGRTTIAAAPPEPVLSYGVPVPPSSAKGAEQRSKLKSSVAPAEPETSLVQSEPSLGEILRRTAPADDVARETSPPRADSLAVLLEQGLKSEDQSLLRSVLQRSDEILMRKTLDQLPVQYTLPLIRYLGKMCAEERAVPNRAPLQWLSLVLTIRASYLTTLPDLAEQLRSVYVYCDRRTKYTDRFLKLHGVVTAAVNLVKQRDYQNSEAEAAKQKAVLTYNEPLDGTDTEEEDTEDDGAEANTDEDMPTEESGNDTEDSETEDRSHKRKTKKQQRDKRNSEDESEEEHVKRKPMPSLSIADPDTDDE